MKRRQGYKGYLIEARSSELKGEQHDASSLTETQLYLPNNFSIRTLGFIPRCQRLKSKRPT